ncbi:MAG TPA: hypothetical protein PLU17_09250 [Chitinophagaceae bacterium]|jgi:hypothetical protein|nr:hypothetical protein [Chitinophagaceae bacterium]
MKFNDIINNIVEDYLAAWNGKDINKILGIFSENGQLESPLFRLINPKCLENKVTGKEKLASSYRLLFNSPNYFKMDKVRIEKHDKTITAYVNGLSNNQVLKSTFTLNEYGKLQYLFITEE